jgi:hypothetical protein
VVHSQGTFETTQHPDLLAAVVLDALVRAATPLTLAQLATACERDPGSGPERTAIEEALESFIADGLAWRHPPSREESCHRQPREEPRQQARYCPTRAALRADALRF